MSRPSLPSYFDDEVSCFHPVFEFAANEFLTESGLSKNYRVVHHRLIGSGIEVDFAFENLSTGKIVLLCELKRTISDVRSLRTRLQAQGYRTEAGGDAETDYFLVSNLEILELFKFSPQRQRVAQQQVQPSPMIIGNLSYDNPDKFYDKLKLCIKEALLTSINDTGVYLEGMTKVQPILHSVISDESRWHQILVPASFEYIRGAASNLPGFQQKLKSAQWQIADNYKTNPKRLIKAGRKIDFDALFSDPPPNPNDSDAFDSDLLDDAYNSGKLTSDATDLTALIEELLVPAFPGMVQTDAELAIILSIIAKDSLGRNLDSNEIISDPGAGCGNLLIAASEIFSDITANQIWANEKEKRFLEVLSVRLGLRYAQTLSRTTQPKITSSDINSLPKSDFSNVKVILMNPPFLAGISSVRERKDFSNRIKQLTGKPSILNHGQIGLEAIFIELIWHLVPNGTVIAIVMPHRWLSGLSSEVTNLRNFLCKNFGLTHIAHYPRRGLFEDVVKHTIIAAGVKGHKAESIKWANFQIPLENINFSQCSQGLHKSDKFPTRGVELKIIAVDELIQLIDTGWNQYLDSGRESKDWFHNLTKGMIQIKNSALGIRRGPSGNQGCSTLCMIDSRNISNNPIAKSIPKNWLFPAIKNSKFFQKRLNKATAPNLSPVLPARAWENGTKENNILGKIVVDYLVSASQNIKAGKQPRKKADSSKVMKALKTNKLTPPPLFSILIPRAIRKDAKIYIVEKPSVVSTNFFIIIFKTKSEAELAASWFFSVFGQIDMELKNLDQEGMRKLEGTQIGELFCPQLSKINNQSKKQFLQAFDSDPPLDFTNLIPRTTDQLWATHLYPFNPQELLDEAFDILYNLHQTRSRN